MMTITITAHPSSKRPRIEKDLFGSIHVYVSQPPLEGKANQAIIEALAKYLGVRKNQLELVRGEKSRQKTFQILPQ